jgi:hypothetical protein
MSDLFVKETIITERSGGAKVDILLSDATSAVPEANETIRFSVEVIYEGYPRLIEVQKLALQRVRDAIGAQILRISGISGQLGE